MRTKTLLGTISPRHRVDHFGHRLVISVKILGAISKQHVAQLNITAYFVYLQKNRLYTRTLCRLLEKNVSFKIAHARYCTTWYMLFIFILLQIFYRHARHSTSKYVRYCYGMYHPFFQSTLFFSTFGSFAPHWRVHSIYQYIRTIR